MRTGFGAPHSTVKSLESMSWADAVNSIVDANPTSLAPDPTLDESWGQFVAMTNYWLDRSREPANQLREKMVLFWHGTLCSSIQKVFHQKMMWDQNQLFRSKGLGAFDELILDVSRGPAMLRYLDNNKNTKDRPNDNFARELMELFTVGVGQYSETDVTESARAWTGETYDDDTGVYQFRPDLHDGGSKTFLGKTGNLRGPDTINELLFGKTAGAHDVFIARKLWTFFAYPNPNDSVVADIAQAYRSSGLNIREAIRAILMHPEFLSDTARQGIAQSPLEFAVATMRHVDISFFDMSTMWLLQGMGQNPFRPPNVAGWHQNEAWLTESNMWAKALFISQVRWAVLKKEDLPTLEELDRGDPVQILANYLNMGPLSPEATATLQDFAAKTTDKWHKRSGLVYLLLLTPEMMVA